MGAVLEFWLHYILNVSMEKRKLKEALELKAHRLEPLSRRRSTRKGVSDLLWVSPVSPAPGHVEHCGTPV